MGHGGSRSIVCLVFVPLGDDFPHTVKKLIVQQSDKLEILLALDLLCLAHLESRIIRIYA